MAISSQRVAQLDFLKWATEKHRKMALYLVFLYIHYCKNGYLAICTEFIFENLLFFCIFAQILIINTVYPKDEKKICFILPVFFCFEFVYGLHSGRTAEFGM